jgi:hypothetical protein
MAYAQQFGLSRNSPLSKRYADKLKDGDIEPSESDKKWGYTGPDGKVTGTEYSDPKSEYNTVGAGKGRGAWDPKGGSDGKGGYSEAIFTDKELSDAKKQVDLKTKIDQVKGGETWKNSKYNKNPKLGFNEDGQATYNSRGDKMFLGDEDVTKEYYENHNKAGGKNQTFGNKLDYAQEALDYAGLATGVGAIPDLFNSAISGVRGAVDYASGGDNYKQHFKDSGRRALYAAPLVGDSMMLANKANKFSKLNNKYNIGRNILKNPTLNKAINTTSKGTKKRPSGEQLLSFGEGAFTNAARGFGNFAFRKNKNTKINSMAQNFLKNKGFGDKFSKLGAEQLGKLTSAKGLEKLTVPGADASIDSIQNAFTGIDTSKIAQGGFAPQQDQFTKPESKKVAKKVDTNPENASSIIEQNNSKSNIETT